MRTALFTTAAICCAGSLQAQSASPDTMPSAVIQRFVDAANARKLDGMMEVVAPQAVFAQLPDDGRALTGRDSVRARYARSFERLAPGFRVSVVSRIADGPFVTDLELFNNADGTTGRATWIYYVANGQIQRAWVLREPRTRP